MTQLDYPDQEKANYHRESPDKGTEEGDMSTKVKTHQVQQELASRVNDNVAEVIWSQTTEGFNIKYVAEFDREQGDNKIFQ